MLYFYHFINHGIAQFFILPSWWYTRGLNLVMTKLARQQLVEWRRLGILLWLKNLFTPMFNDYTIIGRGLSFVVRIFVIIFRLIDLLLRFIFKIILILIWLALPLFVIYGVAASLT